MAWWNFKRENKSPRTLEVKSTLGSELSHLLVYGASKGAENPRSAMNLFETSSAVSIPINRIADSISNLVPVLEIGGKKIVDHPMLTYLKNPCYAMDYRLLMKSSAVYYLVTGETFFLAVGNINRPPLEFYSVSPTLVSHNTTYGMIDRFTIDGEFYPSNYSFDSKTKSFMSRENLKQLTHLRDFSGKDNSVVRGISRLISVSNSARQQILGTRHNLSILEKGGRLSLLFHFENAMDDDQFQKVAERVREQFGGADNAGQIGITAGGKLQVENAGLTPQDMDWGNAQRMANQVLILSYNLPLPLFSLDASTFNNMSSAMEMYYDDAILPNAQILFDSIGSILFPRFGLDANAKLTCDIDKITALTTRRNNEVKLRKDIGIESDNELRSILGREGYAGGDTMYKPSNLIPIGTDILKDDDDITDIGVEDEKK